MFNSQCFNFKTMQYDNPQDTNNTESLGHLFENKISTQINCAAVFIAWLILTLVNISHHHLIPPDETRYVSVAWEMWHRHDFLVPHINGVVYEHKPPMLFWLYLIGWALMGVNETWPLLVSPLCALISLCLTGYLARLLWPNKPSVILMAPWLLLGSLTWCVFLNSAMFDTLLTVFVLTAIIGLVRVARHSQSTGWLMFGLGTGLGLLTKGPVVFVHVLVPFLSGVFWHENVRSHSTRWYFSGVLALLAGIALALAWALPAIAAVDDKFGISLLWHQTAHRVTDSFAHKHPFWWYLALSPILFFPWFFWPRIWRNLIKQDLADDWAYRLCMIWFVGGFICFCLISGKQVHYLIPLFPALALILSRILPIVQKGASLSDSIPYFMIMLLGSMLLILPQISGIKLYHWMQHRILLWPIFICLIGIAGMVSLFITRAISPVELSLATILAVTVSIAGFFDSMGPAFNMQTVTKELEKDLKAGYPIAFAGNYNGQFQFLLRLQEPMTVIPSDEKVSWLQSHPHGRVVSLAPFNTIPDPQLKMEYQQIYREEQLWIQSLR